MRDRALAGLWCRVNEIATTTEDTVKIRNLRWARAASPGA